jgi:hypothetical protein
MNNLSASLPDGCQLTEYPLGHEPRLLLELPPGSIEQFLAFVHFPLGMDQTPRSFFAQKGPPGWTRNTSIFPSRNRYRSNPALFFVMRISIISSPDECMDSEIYGQGKRK